MDWLAVFGAVVGIAGLYFAWRSLDDRPVKLSQDKFRSTRKELRERAGPLSKLAANMHLASNPSLRRIGNSDLLADASMTPSVPVPLNRVRVKWDDADPPHDAALQGIVKRILPKRARWEKFQSYSEALGNLARPALFENRFTFRLIEADWNNPQGPELAFGKGTYFDVIDQGEAVAHELASASRRTPTSTPPWRKLPLRARFRTDPLSLSSRCVLTSIGTLTIRRTPDGECTYFLLHRGVGQVAVGEGIYHVIPGGMFQPASISPLGYLRDLDMWRNIMREYNEEMLGAPEATGESGMEVDYSDPPYSDFEQARSGGQLRVWSLGMGLEPINLVPCLLTIAVFDSQVFDQIFSSIVDRNDEGVLITGPRSAGVTGLPLDASEVGRLLKNENVAPIAAALLHLALHHRSLLLDG
ncbi:transcriptional regulator [Streptomyces sp. NPDC006365]|uniref:transcriptional regulator n=1 Tax=Streptomyces sp. NPDC006365 TaxID=3364744 RepID=UPI0036AC38E9